MQTIHYYNDLPLEVEFDISPYYPATMYDRNGDPGSPAEGGEADISAIYLGGQEITRLLSEKVIEDIRTWLEEQDWGEDGE
jgi:hypothetical protein